ncbi:MAG: penicillin-binding protein activator LpoB [Victivallales bacterium]|jgi:uncharacterized protein (TIGR02722 family)|nr:penicillin-binding protein activator LpoB [Victivallales bacterium]
MKINKIAMVAALAGSGLLITGCGSSPTRIDPKSNQGLTTVDDLNFKDYQDAAESLINDILRSGELKRADGRKTVMMISTVKNSTYQHIQTNLLTDKIRLAVLRSGQAVTTTAVGADGPSDKATRQVRKLQDDPMFNQQTVQQDGTVIAPDMSLAGEIIQKKTTQGRTSESYFYIHMTLTDLKTGLAVWEGEKEVAKQETKPVFGW